MSATTVEGQAEITTTINTNLRIEIARRNLTNVALASQIGMPYQGFWRRMTGEVPWRVDELALVGLALGVEPASLVTPS